MRSRLPLRATAICIATATTLAACGSDDSTSSDSGVDDTGSEGTTDPVPATDDAEPVGTDSADDTQLDDGVTVDLVSEREDVDCSDEGLGADEVISFTAGHYVVDGVLGALCTGEADERLVVAWEDLATIVPRGQLADLGVFTALVEEGAGDEFTLAFVQPLDADGTLFQMSVNTTAYEDDPSEGLLTMAHEFSHVFTSIPSQVDRTVEAVENCATFTNAESCFVEDSLINRWVDTFWYDELLDSYDPFVEASGAEGEGRCAIEPGFLGAYAASTPEEDFAESFSAYVFDVPAATPQQQERFDWLAAQPGLVEYRERAEAAGLTPLDNNFDVCGEDV